MVRLYVRHGKQSSGQGPRMQTGWSALRLETWPLGGACTSFCISHRYRRRRRGVSGDRRYDCGDRYGRGLQLADLFRTAVTNTGGYTRNIR